MADLKHGDDSLRHGERNLVWGFFADGVDLSSDPIAHWLAEATYPDGELFRVWTGVGPLDFEGERYTGITPRGASVSGLLADEGNEDAQRVQITLRGIPLAVRPLLHTYALVRIRLRVVYSLDGGVRWQAVPRSMRGWLSNATLTGDEYTFELATRISDTDRGHPLMWEDAAQRRRANGDRGLEHVGTSRQRYWPNV